MPLSTRPTTVLAGSGIVVLKGSQAPTEPDTVWHGALAAVIGHGWHAHYIVLAQVDQEQRERSERTLEAKV